MTRPVSIIQSAKNIFSFITEKNNAIRLAINPPNNAPGPAKSNTSKLATELALSVIGVADHTVIALTTTPVAMASLVQYPLSIR